MDVFGRCKVKVEYPIRKMWVVIVQDGKRHGMFISNREWTRDPSGQMWVLHRERCIKAVAAQPYIFNWMDMLMDDQSNLFPAADRFK